MLKRQPERGGDCSRGGSAATPIPYEIIFLAPLLLRRSAFRHAIEGDHRSTPHRNDPSAPLGVEKHQQPREAILRIVGHGQALGFPDRIGRTGPEGFRFPRLNRLWRLYDELVFRS